jgi:hypothetical protein
MQTIKIELHADTEQARRELRELELRAEVISSKPGTEARIRATEALSRYYTRSAIEANRAYAALCSPWNPRRWRALLRAWRYERDLGSTT